MLDNIFFFPSFSALGKGLPPPSSVVVRASLANRAARTHPAARFRSQTSRTPSPAMSPPSGGGRTKPLIATRTFYTMQCKGNREKATFRRSFLRAFFSFRSTFPDGISEQTFLAFHRKWPRASGGFERSPGKGELGRQLVLQLRTSVSTQASFSLAYCV